MDIHDCQDLPGSYFEKAVACGQVEKPECEAVLLLLCMRLNNIRQPDGVRKDAAEPGFGEAK